MSLWRRKNWKIAKVGKIYGKRFNMTKEIRWKEAKIFKLSQLQIKRALFISFCVEEFLFTTSCTHFHLVRLPSVSFATFPDFSDWTTPKPTISPISLIWRFLATKAELHCFAFFFPLKLYAPFGLFVVEHEKYHFCRGF